MNAVALTDQGRVRSSNQDTVFAENYAVGALPNLYLVADGMGGHRAGDYCSQTLTTRIISALRESEGKLPLPALRDAVLLANESLYVEAQRHTELEGMGTTLVAAFLEEQSATVLNIGDSRCYELTSDGGFRQITRDHSYVEEMVSAGKMRRGSEAYNRAKNIITRAIGVGAAVEMDLFELPLEGLSMLLLCTDGLTNMLGDDEIGAILRGDETLFSMAEHLIQAANEKGGRDNISVVLVDLREGAQEE
jgi:hypothetical protein